ncbi:hypothetical protein INT47_001586 [Mucor saturninus]|uniref:Uncharacterized protein n=1 Tax=Mucor saturninus TaxID=64648 RepID=A0A8H7V2V4_9FUNG|nr:hypothetical protein INT47_001586 [Mucor saturninus]
MPEPRVIVPCHVCGHVFLSKKGYLFHQTKPNDCVPISKKTARAHAQQICAALEREEKVKSILREFALEPVEEEEEEELELRFRALLDNIV